MSTRGTYKIYDSYNDCNVYFYVHHDNYPSGAVKYLENMVAIANEHKNRTYAKHFILANPNAEFTRSHKYHADTEYRYDIYLHKSIDNWQIKAYDVYERKTFYKGLLEEFISTYKKTIEQEQKEAEFFRISEIFEQLARDIHN